MWSSTGNRSDGSPHRVRSISMPARYIVVPDRTREWTVMRARFIGSSTSSVRRAMGVFAAVVPVAGSNGGRSAT